MKSIDVLEKILKENPEKQYQIRDFVTATGVSRQTVSTSVKSLLLKGSIIKYGTSPKVFFSFNSII